MAKGRLRGVTRLLIKRQSCLHLLGMTLDSGPNRTLSSKPHQARNLVQYLQLLKSSLATCTSMVLPNEPVSQGLDPCELASERAACSNI